MTKTENYSIPRMVVEGKIVGKVSQKDKLIGLLVKQGQRFIVVKYPSNVTTWVFQCVEICSIKE